MRKVFLVALWVLAAARQEDAGAAGAELRCEHREEPGRVRCDVEVRAPSGERIADGDVVILRVPPFVTTLRGRTGPHDATTREGGVWRWTIALAARRTGIGEVEAKVRIVSCRGALCGPREWRATSPVVVGGGVVE